MAFPRAWLGMAFAAVAALVPAAAGAQTPPAGFQEWLDGVRREASAAGVSQATLDAALDGLAPIDRVLELDRRQPEFTQTLWTYLDRSITPERIARGRELLAKHADLLARVERRYGVQPRFLVAFWGLESNFGDHTGGFPVVGALATLAFDERRRAFFREQLLDALKILDEGHVRLDGFQGSWAGAMGQLQFIPATFRRYAVDFDGDGRRDIWGSLPDVFASAAHFLSGVGWRGDETWGREVRLPPGFDWELADLRVRKPIAEWQRLGVRRADGGDLPQADIAGAIVLPAGHTGPAFLVYGNLDAILTWNRSLLYAIAVGHLADRLVGLGPLRATRPALDQALSRAEVEELQALLAELGYAPGEADGVLGSQTRTALKAFQRQAGVPADGYPTPEMLARVRRVAAQEANAN